MPQRPQDRARGPASTLQTADRALQILQLFSSPDQALSVTEIARRLGLHRSTTSRLVGTLEARGFVERRTAGELVRLGPELGRLGRLALGARDLADVALPVLNRLSAQTGETATLTVPAGDEVVIVAQSNGRHFVSSGNWVGVRSSPHCCSDGKVLLAYGGMRDGGHELSRLASNTITERAALARELQEVRRRGFALADGEMEEGLVGLAVPVRDGGACVAAICVSGPRYRLDPDAVTAFMPVCLRAAAELEQRLGAAATAPTVARVA